MRVTVNLSARMRKTLDALRVRNKMAEDTQYDILILLAILRAQRELDREKFNRLIASTLEQE